MSFRKFNPFSSNASISTGRGSTRPPTYFSNVTYAPTYTSQDPRTNSADDYDGRESRGSADARSAWLSPSPADTMFDDAKPPLYNEISILSALAEPRYIYYRVYAEDGAIPSENPVYSDDPYLGCISAKLVVPPYIVINVKDCLSNVERIKDTVSTSLYVSASSQTPMDNASHVSILTYPGPGCTPNEPMALLGKFTVRRPPSDVVIVARSKPFENQYIYYQVYKSRGAVPSIRPADSNDPYVGHICVDIIPPPHTATSIMRCICKAETLKFSKHSRLFSSITSRSPIGEGHVSILASGRPGSTPEDPMVLFIKDPRLKNLPNIYDALY